VDGDAGIGIGLADLGPDAGTGGRHRRRSEAPVDLLDQGKLPDAALQLPDAERDEPRDRQERERPQREPFHIPLISPDTGIGIMFAFIWYITHIDPIRPIATITIVKISAIIVQPFSELLFMWRK
jgi:hypothetical protein